MILWRASSRNVEIIARLLRMTRITVLRQVSKTLKRLPFSCDMNEQLWSSTHYRVYYRLEFKNVVDFLIGDGEKSRSRLLTEVSNPVAPSEKFNYCWYYSYHLCTIIYSSFIIASVTIIVILIITDVHQQLVASRLNGDASIVQWCVKCRCGVLKYAITIFAIIDHSTCYGYYQVIIAKDDTHAWMISVYILNYFMLYYYSVYSFCNVLSLKHFYSS